MSRLGRIEYPGAFYHVTNRGNRKQPIVRSDDDRLLFLNCLREAHARLGAVVHVYCLMDNHYHLFLETPRGNLSRTMHLINLKYAAYFNRKYSLDGHTFQGRFQAILVQAVEYACEVAPYIHLNPVRAQLVDRPEEFRWSNYRAYLGLTPPESWAPCSFILSLFGASLPEARKRYERQVLSRIGLPAQDPFGPAASTGILGRPEFIAKIQRPGKADPVGLSEPNASQTGLSTPRPSLSQIQEQTRALCGQENPLSRKIAIYIAHENSGLPLSVISEFFSIGRSGITDICRRMKREIVNNETLARVVGEVEFRLRRDQVHARR